MKVEIANPIYDVVFKYMMEDNTVAKLLVSSIIGEEVVSLEPKPQEHTTEVTAADDKRSLTVYHLDFSAKIKTPEGHKLIIIEMQKASVPTDIQRFRMYLGKQYSDANNYVTNKDGKEEFLQIYTIYFLGDALNICDTPVLSVFPDIRDVATQQIIEGKSAFIELLNHRCWIVQISCLKKRRRNELELLLSVFDQTNLTNDHHILNVNEEDFPEKYRPLIRRLKKAASIPEVKKQMDDEDGVLRYMQSLQRGARYEGKVEGKVEGKAEGLVEGEAIGREKGKAEGLAEGLEKGRAEGAAKIQEQNVLNANRKGIPVETISFITGLTPEQITEILKRQGL